MYILTMEVFERGFYSDDWTHVKVFASSRKTELEDKLKEWESKKGYRVVTSEITEVVCGEELIEVADIGTSHENYESAMW